MNVVEWRTRIEGASQDLSNDSHRVCKNFDSIQRRFERMALWFVATDAFKAASFDRKIALHVTARLAPGIIARSRRSLRAN
jgi:hypothetical protein